MGQEYVYYLVCTIAINTHVKKIMLLKTKLGYIK